MCVHVHMYILYVYIYVYQDADLIWDVWHPLYVCVCMYIYVWLKGMHRSVRGVELVDESVKLGAVNDEEKTRTAVEGWNRSEGEREGARMDG